MTKLRLRVAHTIKPPKILACTCGRLDTAVCECCPQNPPPPPPPQDPSLISMHIIGKNTNLCQRISGLIQRIHHGIPIFTANFPRILDF